MARLKPLAVSVMVVVGITAWLGASSPGTLPAGDFTPRPAPVLVVNEATRLDALSRAAVQPRLPLPPPPLPVSPSSFSCLFTPDEPSGTTPKFRCALPGGEVIKVKYGRTPEIHAEVAATQLLQRLGYAADTVRIVPRVRCYGCPRYPFMTSRLWQMPLLSRIVHAPDANSYTEFDMVAVEWTYPAAAIETESTTGWAWWELKHSTAAREELDALRLLAVFLAHWDNKADNQRLVCVDPAGNDGASGCSQPLLVIQDLGATFGPYKANLTGWRTAPVWADITRCRVSMRSLPFDGASFPDAEVSEAGRLRLVGQLRGLTADDVRAIFETARFHDYQSATDDERDLQAWTKAFRERLATLEQAGPCPNP